MTKLLTTPRDKITVVEGRNARKIDDKDLEGLRLSIQRRGILVPLIVEENGTGYKLVAGHRRLRVAELDKIDEIPISVLEEGDDPAKVEKAAMEVTAIENMQRVQLNPIEEAQAIQNLIDLGYTEKGAAEALSISPHKVTLRLPLLTLPTFVQQLIADGKIRVTGTDDAIYELNKVSPRLCELVVQAFVTEQIHDIGWSSTQTVVLKHGVGKDELWPVNIDNFPEAKLFKKLGLTKEEIEQAKAMQGPPPDSPYAYQHFYDMDLDEALVMEASNAGYAYAGSRYGGRCTGVVHGTEAFAELVKRQLAADHAEWLNRQQRKKADADRPKASDRTEAEKEERKQQLTRIREHMAEARGVNLKLGADLLNKLGKLKWTKESADVIAALVLDARLWGDDAMNAYAQRGLRYVFESFQRDETKIKKDGSKGVTKITYNGPTNEGDVRELAWKFYDGAKTAEEKLGRLMIILSAAQFATDHAVSEAQARAGTKPFRDGDRWSRPSKRDKAGLEALKKIAKPALSAGWQAFTRKKRPT